MNGQPKPLYLPAPLDDRISTSHQPFRVSLVSPPTATSGDPSANAGMPSNVDSSDRIDQEAIGAIEAEKVIKQNQEFAKEMKLLEAAKTVEAVVNNDLPLKAKRPLRGTSVSSEHSKTETTEVAAQVAPPPLSIAEPSISDSGFEVSTAKETPSSVSAIPSGIRHTQERSVVLPPGSRQTPERGATLPAGPRHIPERGAILR